MTIELKDIPGAGLVGSVVAFLGDIVLFGGDLIVATGIAFLSSVQFIGPAVSTLGQFLKQSGVVSAEIGEIISLIGIGMLLTWLLWRAGRGFTKNISKQVNE